MNTSSPLTTGPTPDFVTLSDGRRGIRTGLATQIREPSPEPGHTPAVLDFIASSDALDRCGEVIDPFGWQLENYRRNPVFQNAHQYGDIIFTLGKALITQVRHLPGPTGELRPALYQQIEFAVDANPMARIAYGLYKGKFLNAVSVGFIPLRWVDADGTEHSLTERGRRAAADVNEQTRASAAAGFRRKYIFQELLEVSAVGIPANPEALQLGLKAGAIEKSDIQHLLDLLAELTGRSDCAAAPQSPTTDYGLPTNDSATHFRSHTAGVVANPSARGHDANGAQLLQMARALTKLLRRT